MQNKLKEKITNNNKGYLIVEIIVSFIIVMAIAFFLIQLTSKFLSQNDDTYNETVLLTDKALMTSTIMNDVNSKKLINVTKIETCAYLVFTTNPEDVSAGTTTVKKLSLINDNDNKILSYGEVGNSIYSVDSNKIDIVNGCNVAYIGEEYTKKFNEILVVQELAIKSTPIDNSDNTITDSQLTISIPAYTAYSKEDYGLKVVIPYSSKQLSYKNHYTIEVEVVNGKIEGSSSKKYLKEEGESFNVQITPETNYQYKNINNECKGFYSNNELNITSVTENLHCKITYEEISYSVNITAKNGSVLPSSFNIISNGVKEVKLFPNTGYQYSSNDCGITPINNVLKFSNITSDISCTVEFAQSVKSCDSSGANAPKLVDGMIPVYYKNGSWYKADKDNNKCTGTSTSYEHMWYNYTDKQWANIVLVSSGNRQKYINASPGQKITDSDILAFYVWIPRYKYKVWNINKVIGTDTYDAYHTGIDIKWEKGTGSTGNVACTYYYTAPVATAGLPNEICTVAGDASNPYYTHPAFTFGSNELTGIWVGKFETSSNTHLTGTSYGGGNVTNLTARIVPNVTSWRYIEVGNAFTVVQNMQKPSNEYGLLTDKTKVDSHLMKNTEWGAVAYLTNSIYGKCTGSSGGCTEVQINSHWDNSDGGTDPRDYYTSITGCGPKADGRYFAYDTACTEYNTPTGMLASTTGNITGVYDMSGGAWERVMGNMSSATGAYTFYPSNTSSTMPVSWYTATTSKYVDTYAYDSNRIGQIAYNRSRLGDATGETIWYGDYDYFVHSRDSWFARGGQLEDQNGAGAFHFNNSTGGGSYFATSASFRASLVLLR